MYDSIINVIKRIVLLILVLVSSVIGSSVFILPPEEPIDPDLLFSDYDVSFSSDEPDIDSDAIPDETDTLASDQPSEPESELDPDLDIDPEPESGPEPEYFTIAMMGDCTFASEHEAKGNAQAFERVVGDDYAYPFSMVKQLYEDADFVMVNLECAITEHDSRTEKSFHFRAEPDYVNILIEGGIDCVALGNNHTMDYGQIGYDDTQAILDEQGIGYAPNSGWRLFKTDSGLTIGVYSKNLPSNTDVIRAATQMKDSGAELIIMALHWGDEGSYRATATQKQTGRAAIDAGAHIIMGTHPHTLQEMEIYKGGYIYYSLGNWSFGGHTNPRDKDSILAKVHIMRDLDGSISIIGADNIPCSTSGSVSINDYRPVPYEVDTAEFDRTLSKLDGSFTGPNLVVSYDDPDDEESPNPDDAPSEENTPSAVDTPSADNTPSATDTPGTENAPGTDVAPGTVIAPDDDVTPDANDTVGADDEDTPNVDDTPSADEPTDAADPPSEGDESGDTGEESSVAAASMQSESED